MAEWIAWFHANDTLIRWLIASSFATLVATMIVVPWFVLRMPADYFLAGRARDRAGAHKHPAIRALLVIGKNVLGYVFIAAGILMLVLPGQGVLTILMGIVLADFPGRRRLARWIVARVPVLRAINWLRRQAGKPPMQMRDKQVSASRARARTR